MMNMVRLYDRLYPLMRYGAPLFLVGILLHIFVDKPWTAVAAFVLGAPAILTCLVGAACAACIAIGVYRCPTCHGRLTWDMPAIQASMRRSPFSRPPTPELICEQCRRSVEFTEAGLTPKPAAEE